MALPEILTAPVPLAILTAVVFALIHYQRGLNWYEYRTLHGLKRIVVPIIDARGPDFHWVAEKGYRDDDEYLRTEPMPVRDVIERLVGHGGGDPHLLNSLKRRPLPGGSTQLSAAHVVWLHDDGSQTEAYLFANSGGTTDVYVHHERGVQDPEGHLSEPQTDGDVRGVVTDALPEA